MKLKLQVVLIPAVLANVNTDKVTSYKKFLHLADPQSTIGEVCDALVTRYYKLYPDAKQLRVEGVQDNDRCDLDPDFCAADVFLSGDTLRILCENLLEHLGSSMLEAYETWLPDSTAALAGRKRTVLPDLDSEDSRYIKRSRTIWGVRLASLLFVKANRTREELFAKEGTRLNLDLSSSEASVVRDGSLREVPCHTQIGWVADDSRPKVPAIGAHRDPKCKRNPVALTTDTTVDSVVHVSQAELPLLLPPPERDNTMARILLRKRSSPSPYSGKRITSGMLLAPLASALAAPNSAPGSSSPRASAPATAPASARRSADGNTSAVNTTVSSSHAFNTATRKETFSDNDDSLANAMPSDFSLIAKRPGALSSELEEIDSASDTGSELFVPNDASHSTVDADLRRHLPPSAAAHGITPTKKGSLVSLTPAPMKSRLVLPQQNALLRSKPENQQAAPSLGMFPRKGFFPSRADSNVSLDLHSSAKESASRGTSKQENYSRSVPVVSASVPPTVSSVPETVPKTVPAVNIPVATQKTAPVPEAVSKDHFSGPAPVEPSPTHTNAATNIASGPVPSSATGNVVVSDPTHVYPGIVDGSPAATASRRLGHLNKDKSRPRSSHSPAQAPSAQAPPLPGNVHLSIQSLSEQSSDTPTAASVPGPPRSQPLTPAKGKASSAAGQANVAPRTDVSGVSTSTAHATQQPKVAGNYPHYQVQGATRGPLPQNGHGYVVRRLSVIQSSTVNPHLVPTGQLINSAQQSYPHQNLLAAHSPSRQAYTPSQQTVSRQQKGQQSHPVQQYQPVQTACPRSQRDSSEESAPRPSLPQPAQSAFRYALFQNNPEVRLLTQPGKATAAAGSASVGNSALLRSSELPTSLRELPAVQVPNRPRSGNDALNEMMNGPFLLYPPFSLGYSRGEPQKGTSLSAHALPPPGQQARPRSGQPYWQNRGQPQNQYLQQQMRQQGHSPQVQNIHKQTAQPAQPPVQPQQGHSAPEPHSSHQLVQPQSSSTPHKDGMFALDNILAQTSVRSTEEMETHGKNFSEVVRRSKQTQDTKQNPALDSAAQKVAPIANHNAAPNKATSITQNTPKSQNQASEAHVVTLPQQVLERAPSIRTSPLAAPKPAELSKSRATSVPVIGQIDPSSVPNGVSLQRVVNFNQSVTVASINGLVGSDLATSTSTNVAKSIDSLTSKATVPAAFAAAFVSASHVKTSVAAPVTAPVTANVRETASVSSEVSMAASKPATVVSKAPVLTAAEASLLPPKAPAAPVASNPVARASPEPNAQRRTSVSKETVRNDAKKNSAHLSKDEIISLFKGRMRVPNKINQKLAIPEPASKQIEQAELERKNRIRMEANLAQTAQELDNRRRAATTAAQPSTERSLRSRVNIGGIQHFDINTDSAVDEVRERERDERAKGLPYPFCEFAAKSKLSAIYIKMKKFEAKLAKEEAERQTLKIKSEPGTPKTLRDCPKMVASPEPRASERLVAQENTLPRAGSASSAETSWPHPLLSDHNQMASEESETSPAPEEPSELVTTYSDSGSDYCASPTPMADCQSPESYVSATEPSPSLEELTSDDSEPISLRTKRPGSAFPRPALKKRSRPAYRKRLAKQFEEAEIISLESSDSEISATTEKTASANGKESAQKQKEWNVNVSRPVDPPSGPVIPPVPSKAPVPSNSLGPSKAPVGLPRAPAEIKIQPSRNTPVHCPPGNPVSAPEITLINISEELFEEERDSRAVKKTSAPEKVEVPKTSRAPTERQQVTVPSPPRTSQSQTQLVIPDSTEDAGLQPLMLLASFVDASSVPIQDSLEFIVEPSQAEEREDVLVERVEKGHQGEKVEKVVTEKVASEKVQVENRQAQRAQVEKFQVQTVRIEEGEGEKGPAEVIRAAEASPDKAAPVETTPAENIRAEKTQAEKTIPKEPVQVQTQVWKEPQMQVAQPNALKPEKVSQQQNVLQKGLHEKESLKVPRKELALQEKAQKTTQVKAPQKEQPQIEWLPKDSQTQLPQKGPANEAWPAAQVVRANKVSTTENPSKQANEDVEKTQLKQAPMPQKPEAEPALNPESKPALNPETKSVLTPSKPKPKSVLKPVISPVPKPILSPVITRRVSESTSKKHYPDAKALSSQLNEKSAEHTAKTLPPKKSVNAASLQTPQIHTVNRQNDDSSSVSIPIVLKNAGASQSQLKNSFQPSLAKEATTNMSKKVTDSPKTDDAPKTDDSPKVTDNSSKKFADTSNKATTPTPKKASETPKKTIADTPNNMDTPKKATVDTPKKLKVSKPETPKKTPASTAKSPYKSVLDSNRRSSLVVTDRIASEIMTTLSQRASQNSAEVAAGAKTSGSSVATDSGQNDETAAQAGAKEVVESNSQSANLQNVVSKAEEEKAEKAKTKREKLQRKKAAKRLRKEKEKKEREEREEQEREERERKGETEEPKEVMREELEKTKKKLKKAKEIDSVSAKQTVEVLSLSNDSLNSLTIDTATKDAPSKNDASRKKDVPSRTDLSSKPDEPSKIDTSAKKILNPAADTPSKKAVFSKSDLSSKKDASKEDASAKIESAKSDSTSTKEATQSSNDGPKTSQEKPNKLESTMPTKSSPPPTPRAQVHHVSPKTPSTPAKSVSSSLAAKEKSVQTSTSAREVLAESIKDILKETKALEPEAALSPTTSLALKKSARRLLPKRLALSSKASNKSIEPSELLKAQATVNLDDQSQKSSPEKLKVQAAPIKKPSKPSLLSLTSLAARGVPEVQDKLHKPAAPICKPSIKAIVPDSSDESGSDSDSGSSSSGSDSDDNANSKFVNLNNLRGENGKKKKNSRFSSLMGDVRRR